MDGKGLGLPRNKTHCQIDRVDRECSLFEALCGDDELNVKPNKDKLEFYQSATSSTCNRTFS